jgi:hypothetical protein
MMMGKRPGAMLGLSFFTMRPYGFLNGTVRVILQQHTSPASTKVSAGQ